MNHLMSYQICHIYDVRIWEKKCFYHMPRLTNQLIPPLTYIGSIDYPDLDTPLQIQISSTPHPPKRFWKITKNPESAAKSSRPKIKHKTTQRKGRFLLFINVFFKTVFTLLTKSDSVGSFHQGPCVSLRRAHRVRYLHSRPGSLSPSKSSENKKCKRAEPPNKLPKLLWKLFLSKGAPLLMTFSTNFGRSCVIHYEKILG